MRKCTFEVKILFVLSFFLNSCAMYDSDFDCPIPKGTQCISLTEIESMIVEQKEGPDLLVLSKDKCTCEDPKQPKNSSNQKRRFWICSQTNDDGMQVKEKKICVDVQGK